MHENTCPKCGSRLHASNSFFLERGDCPKCNGGKVMNAVGFIFISFISGFGLSGFVYIMVPLTGSLAPFTSEAIWSSLRFTMLLSFGLFISTYIFFSIVCIEHRKKYFMNTYGIGIGLILILMTGFVLIDRPTALGLVLGNSYAPYEAALSEYKRTGKVAALVTAANQDSIIDAQLVECLFDRNDSLLTRPFNDLLIELKSLASSPCHTKRRPAGAYAIIADWFQDNKEVYKSLSLIEALDIKNSIGTVVYVQYVSHEVGKYYGTGSLSGASAIQTETIAYVIDMTNRSVTATFSVWGGMPSKKVTSSNMFSSTSGSVPDRESIARQYSTLPLK